MYDGELPKSWKSLRVDDIKAAPNGALVSGPFGSSIGKRFFVSEGVPVIRGNNLSLQTSKFIDNGFVFLTEEKAKEFVRCEAVARDLVFTAAGTIGQVCLIPEDTRFSRYIISNKQIRLRCNTSLVLPEYLLYWFSQPLMKKHILRQSIGTAVPLIHLGILRKLPVIVPPLETQHILVDFFSKIDDVILKTKLMIDEINTLKKGLMRRLLTRGIRHTRLKKTESYHAKQLGDIAEIIPRYAFRSETLCEDGIPVLKIGNIQNGMISKTCLDHLPDDIYTPTLEKYILRVNDFLIAMTGAGSVGKTGKMRNIDNTFLVNQRIAIVRPDSVQCNPDFVFQIISHKGYESRMYALALAGGGQPNISSKEIASLRIPLLSLEIQRTFASHFSIIDECTNNQNGTLFCLEKLKKGLMQVLLTGKVRVR